MKLVRPHIAKLHAYVPGEQPRIKGLIKLNTNENPYPPSPKVLQAVKASVDGRLRLYPDATAKRLREKLAKLHKCAPDQIIIGNGSDELLAMAIRAFVAPVERDVTSKNKVQLFTPSYSLYPVLTAIHGASLHSIPLQPDYSLPTVAQLRKKQQWDPRAALTFVTTPNAPTGKGYSRATLESLCKVSKGVVILDEAYVDFAGEHAMPLALTYQNVLVARTFSKAYSLCFQRVGYFVGHKNLIDGLQNIRDSYNVNGLGQIAALATLEDLPYYRKNFGRVIASRELLSSELVRLGFEVLPSQTNFILTRPSGPPAKVWLEKLKSHKILVRWFDQSGIRDYLRITIGSEKEVAALVKAVKSILKT